VQLISTFVGVFTSFCINNQEQELQKNLGLAIILMSRQATKQK